MFYCSACFVRHGICVPYSANNIVYLKFKFMADIDVQTKRHSTSSTWLWILLALVAAAIIYFLTRDNDRNEGATDINNTTSYIIHSTYETAFRA
jgi:hypothetical protein